MPERPRNILDQWCDRTVSGELEPGGTWFAEMVYVTRPCETKIGMMRDRDGFQGEINAWTVRKAVLIRNALGETRIVPIGRAPRGFHPEDFPHQTIDYEPGRISSDEATSLEEAFESPDSLVLLVSTDKGFTERGGNPFWRRPKKEQRGWRLREE